MTAKPPSAAPPFPPTGTAWRYIADHRFPVVLGSAFLLQVMHPTVAAGIAEHSTFQVDPWGRLHRSRDALLHVLCAEDGAQRGAEIRAAHQHIRGVDRHGRRYHAYEPEAYWWILATGVRATFVFAELVGRPLPSDEQSRVYAEFRQGGTRCGLRDHDMPRTLPEFWNSYRAMLDGRLEDSPVVRDVLQTVKRPPCPSSVPLAAWRPARAPLGHLLSLVTVATLPRHAREILGLRFRPLQEAELRVVTAAARAAGRLPEESRYGNLLALHDVE